MAPFASALGTSLMGGVCYSALGTSHMGSACDWALREIGRGDCTRMCKSEKLQVYHSIWRLFCQAERGGRRRKVARRRRKNSLAAGKKPQSDGRSGIRTANSGLVVVKYSIRLPCPKNSQETDAIRRFEQKSHKKFVIITIFPFSISVSIFAVEFCGAAW